MRSVAAVSALAAGLVFVPAIAMAEPAADPAASVSGVRFFDRNEDGVQQEEEAGTDAGGWEWTVYLETPSGQRVGEGKVDQAGSYNIENLPAGDYVLVFPRSTLYMGTTSERVPVALAAGQEQVVNTGIKGGTITGTAWDDLDDDGQMRAEEPRLAGIEVSDVRTGQSTTTDAQGNYVFEDQTIDEHELHFAVRPGMTFSRPMLGSSDTDSDVIDADNGLARATISTYRGELLNPRPIGAGYVAVP